MFYIFYFIFYIIFYIMFYFLYYILFSLFIHYHLSIADVRGFVGRRGNVAQSESRTKVIGMYQGREEAFIDVSSPIFGFWAYFTLNLDSLSSSSRFPFLLTYLFASELSYLFHLTYHILFLISILFGYHHHHILIITSLSHTVSPISLPPPLPGVRGVQETYGENIVLPNFARSERGVKPPPGMGYIISIPPPGPPLSHPKTLYYSVDYYTIIQCFPVHRQNHSPSFISQISLPFIDRLFW